MEVTNIKLARTGENGTYWNSAFVKELSGRQAISYAQPWVQKHFKQLWIDNVCINPKLTVVNPSVSNTPYNVLQLDEGYTSNESAEYLNYIEFNPAALKSYFQNSLYFNKFYISYYQRDAFNVISVDSNDSNRPIVGSAYIYDPVESGLSPISLGRNIKFSSDGSTKNIETQYISSVQVMTAQQLLNALSTGRSGGSSAYNVEHDDIVDAGAISSSQNQFLVITSNFGLIKYVPIADIQGGMIETHDHLHVSTTATPGQNEEYYTSNEILLYTDSVSHGVQLYHQNPTTDVVTNTTTGTDVHFKLPAVQGNVTQVELVVAVIDGGEIADPNQSGNITPNPAE